MSNNINTMQIWCYINYHWNNTKIKSIQSKLFQCLFYMNKALNLGHLVKVLWKHLNSTNSKGSPLCDVEVASLEEVRFCFLRCAYVDVGGANIDANDIPFKKCDNKFMHHAQPRKDHDNKWLFGKNLWTIMLRVKYILDPEYGRVYSIHGGVMTTTYKVTIRVIPNCTYFDFVFMLTSLKRTKFYPLKTFVFHLWN